MQIIPFKSLPDFKGDMTIKVTRCILSVSELSLLEILAGVAGKCNCFVRVELYNLRAVIWTV